MFHSLIDAKIIGIPTEVLLSCPFVLHKKSAMTQELEEFCFHLVSKQSGAATAASLIAHKHVGEFLRKAVLWMGHVKFFKILQRNGSGGLFSQVPQVEEDFPDFPEFNDHCSYNGTLGPSEKHIADLFYEIVAIHKPFWDRYMGGVTGEKICADHHHNVPARIKVADISFDGKKFAPINGFHGIMSERRQVLSMIATISTTAEERHLQAEELKLRLTARDLKLKVACFDKCCDDCAWLKRKFPETVVVLDNSHLINRYKENCGGADEAVRAVFIRRLSEIMVGAGETQKMKPGMEIYDELTKLIEEFKKTEANLSISQRVVGEKLIANHLHQKKHFQNCLDFPADFPWAIKDRHGTNSVTRGSHQLESFWRWLRLIFPEKLCMKSSMSLLLAGCTEWNFNRELQFDKRWAFLPMSPIHICLTQYIAINSKENGTGVSRMFHKLPLSLSDGIGVCGLAESFFKAAPAPIPVSDEFASFATAAIEFATFNTTVSDSKIEDLLDQCDFGDEDIFEETLSTVDQGMLLVEENRVIEVSVNKQKKANGGATTMHHGGKSRSHKKKSTGVIHLGGKRFGMTETINLYDKSLQHLSGFFNPIERRLMRYVVLHLYPHGENPPTDLKFVKPADLNYALVHKIWTVVPNLSYFKF